MANPAGESNAEVLRLDFDRRLMLQFRESVVTAKRYRARYGFEPEPDARRTGEQRLEWPLCLHLLPSVVRVHQFGDLERCALRPGNVHSADGWDEVLKPVMSRYRGKVSRIYFRADAGFANPEVYEFLEAEGIKYAIRLPANRVLQERIGNVLKRPVGRPRLKGPLAAQMPITHLGVARSILMV